MPNSCHPPANAALQHRIGRRACLQLLGGAACLVHLPGCGYYEAESGAAFEPWDFPGDGAQPELLAAQAALLAASPHNTQPWALRVEPTRIDLYADFSRNLGTMDSLRRELHIGLGCALENLTIAARAHGRACDVDLLPEPAQPNLIARVRLTPCAPDDTANLFDAIATRHTNRGHYLPTPLPAHVTQTLQQLSAADAPDIQLRLLQSDTERARFRDETIAATRAIIDDAEMSRDSERWYRHSHTEIERHRDGVTLDTTGSDTTTRVLGKLFGRPSEQRANAYWLEATIERQTTAPAFGILSSSADNTRAEQLRAGRAYQRLQLWATAHGLAVQPLNQLAERQDREQQLHLAPRFTRVLDEWVGGSSGTRARAQMLFRIGYARDRALASPRRPLSWVRMT